MTWVKARARWMKEYRGKKYAVSCAQLKCPASKDASWLAANNWWTRKQQEIDAAEKPAPIGTVLDQISTALGVEIPPELASQLLALRGRDAVPVRSVRDCVDDWKKSLMGQVNAGNIDISRYDAYCRYVRKFTDWMNDASDVKTIDANKVEAYWHHLGRHVSDGTYSPATAQQAMMTMKQVVRWAVGKGYLTIPSNLNDKRLRFTQPVKAIETVTPADLARVFAVEGYERAKLYALLMLNTGAYQSDVSDLGDSEVDWREGIITRPRSKRSAGVVTRYKLWPETFALLLKHRAKAGVKNELLIG